MYNKAVLMGRICNSLEVKTTPNGVNWLSFRIAVERSYCAKNEERKTDFFNVLAWRSTAEFIAKWFSKGRMILVDGELQTRSYEDKNGVTQNPICSLRCAFGTAFAKCVGSLSLHSPQHLFIVACALSGVWSLSLYFSEKMQNRCS